MLLKELHHRIGNDFQLVLSLISFRAKQTTDAMARTELTWVTARLQALANLHDLLRNTNSSGSVDLGQYFRTMCAQLTDVHKLADRNIQMNVNVYKWDILAKDAISAGFILNEFVTNSVEHAFDDAGGRLDIELAARTDKATLCLTDNGKGSIPRQ